MKLRLCFIRDLADVLHEWVLEELGHVPLVVGPVALVDLGGDAQWDPEGLGDLDGAIDALLRGYSAHEGVVVRRPRREAERR